MKDFTNWTFSELEKDLQKLEKHTEKVNTLCSRYINNSFDYHKDIEAIEDFISYWTRYIKKQKLKEQKI